MLINLKRLREDAGVSQRTLAENIGVSQQSINKYENHNIEPDIETLVRMADYFDTSADYLIGHSSERRRQENVRTFDLNEKEAELIISKIPKGAWFCVFTPEGKLLSSEAMAEQIRNVKLSGKSSCCFLIGSSFGIAKKVKDFADFKLSMSPMTFPHHLARVMVLEQLYRAEAIQAGSKYHK